MITSQEPLLVLYSTIYFSVCEAAEVTLRAAVEMMFLSS